MQTKKINTQEVVKLIPVWSTVNDRFGMVYGNPQYVIAVNEKSYAVLTYNAKGTAIITLPEYGNRVVGKFKKGTTIPLIVGSPSKTLTVLVEGALHHKLQGDVIVVNSKESFIKEFKESKYIITSAELQLFIDNVNIITQSTRDGNIGVSYKSPFDKEDWLNRVLPTLSENLNMDRSVLESIISDIDSK